MARTDKTPDAASWQNRSAADQLRGWRATIAAPQVKAGAFSSGLFLAAEGGSKMKLSTQQRLMAMNNTVAVLRVLTQLDQTLSHKGYAIAVGLMEPDDKWTAWHRTAVGDVLDATSILTKEPLEFNRIVNAATGKPGIGLLAEPKIRA